jgi:hypothetical protein
LGKLGGDWANDHIGTGDHDLTDDHIPEFKDGVKHFPLFFIEDAIGFRFFNELLQLLTSARPPRPAGKNATE